MHSRDKKQTKGFVLIFVMLVIILIAVLAGAFYISSTSTYILVRNNMLSYQVYYLAQSGIDYALSTDLSDTTLWTAEASDIPYDIDEGSVEILVEQPEAQRFDIVSTAVLGNRSRTVAVTVENGKIVSWR
jgi:type II secretory pathway component PulK